MKKADKIAQFIENNKNLDKKEGKKQNLPAKTTPKTEILNEKQQAFVQQMLVEGMSPVDAYIAVYKVSSRKVASTAVYRLLQKAHIKFEIASQSNQLKALSTVPKHYLVKKVKALLEICEADLSNAGNRKYYLECLDMINKMSGHYQDNKTVTNISLSGGFDFGGFNPDSAEPIEAEFIDLSQSNEAKPLIDETTDNEQEDDWSPESDDSNRLSELLDEDDMPF